MIMKMEPLDPCACPIRDDFADMARVEVQTSDCFEPRRKITESLSDHVPTQIERNPTRESNTTQTSGR